MHSTTTSCPFTARSTCKISLASLAYTALAPPLALPALTHWVRHKYAPNQSLNWHGVGNRTMCGRHPIMKRRVAGPVCTVPRPPAAFGLLFGGCAFSSRSRPTKCPGAVPSAAAGAWLACARPSAMPLQAHWAREEPPPLLNWTCHSPMEGTYGSRLEPDHAVLTQDRSAAAGQHAPASMR